MNRQRQDIIRNKFNQGLAQQWLPIPDNTISLFEAFFRLWVKAKTPIAEPIDYDWKSICEQAGVNKQFFYRNLATLQRSGIFKFEKGAKLKKPSFCVPESFFVNRELILNDTKELWRGKNDEMLSADDKLRCLYECIKKNTKNKYPKSFETLLLMRFCDMKWQKDGDITEKMYDKQGQRYKLEEIENTQYRFFILIMRLWTLAMKRENEHYNTSKLDIVCCKRHKRNIDNARFFDWAFPIARLLDETGISNYADLIEVFKYSITDSEPAPNVSYEWNGWRAHIFTPTDFYRKFDSIVAAINAKQQRRAKI